MLCHCGRHIKSFGFVECAICRGKHRFPVPCPICGRIRMLTAVYSAKEECRQAACQACSRQPDYQDMWKAKREAEAQAAHRKIKTKFRPGSATIELNGCTLIRTEGGRCKHYIHCIRGSHAGLFVTREQDCCFQVGKLNWRGFETRGPCFPIYVPDSLRLIELGNRQSCAGLMLDA